MGEFKRLKRELVHKGKVVDFYTDTMQMPDGNQTEWDLISHKGAAAVVALKPDGKILMVRQYRNPLERMVLELPAGKLDSEDENPKACAERELEEETGYKAGKIEHLMDIFTSVAFCNEKISIYVATELTASKQHLDDDEFLNVEAYELSDLLSMIADGKLLDSKTVSGLLMYHYKFNI